MIRQNPKKAVVAKKPVATKVKKKETPNPANDYKGLKDAWGNSVGGEGTRPPFTKKDFLDKEKKIKKNGK
jgi:hypothetical protein